MRRVYAAFVCFSVLFGLAVAAPSSAADKLKVNYNFLLGAVVAGPTSTPTRRAPTTGPAGRPRRTRGRSSSCTAPLGNKNTNWQAYSPLLANNGYCVFSLTYGVVPGIAGPGQPVRRHGPRSRTAPQQLKAFVARVLRATGASKVDLIGHSQGTLMPEYYVKFLGGAKHVKNYVSLAPLWHGTDRGRRRSASWRTAFGFDEDDIPVCPPACQMGTDSKFIAKLRAGGLVVGKRRATPTS